MKRTPRRPGRGRTATPPTTTTPRPARRSTKRVAPSGLVAPVTTAPRTVYPALEPYRHGWLRVSGTHEIYWEESGNPRGKAAVFVHGGPGCGASANSRQYFDPARYRIVVFDQRGCGRSRPMASLEDNTTWHLVEDMEALRKHLRITQWLVFGGSWGSTLALAYAEAHPERVSALVLRGIFLVRRQEIQWFYQHGASEVFPDRWEYFLEPSPAAERGDLVGASYRRLTGTDPRAALRSEWRTVRPSVCRSEAYQLPVISARPIRSLMLGLSSSTLRSGSRAQARACSENRSPFSMPAISTTRFQLRDSGRLCPLDWCTALMPL